MGVCGCVCVSLYVHACLIACFCNTKTCRTIKCHQLVPVDSPLCRMWRLVYEAKLIQV